MFSNEQNSPKDNPKSIKGIVSVITNDSPILRQSIAQVEDHYE
jgi:hypothetical protein